MDRIEYNTGLQRKYFFKEQFEKKKKCERNKERSSLEDRYILGFL